MSQSRIILIINMLERLVRLNNTKINNYMNQINQEIRNEGYIDTIKYRGNIRILILKLRGFNPNNESKIQILLKACNQYQINIVLLNNVKNVL